MQSSFVVLVAVTLLLHSPLVRSAPNDERNTPVPKFSAAQALEKITQYFQEPEPEPGEFIVSVVYARPDKIHLTMNDNPTNTFVLDGEKEWSWFITFSRPHEFEPGRIFRLRDNGAIAPLVQIES